MTGVRTRSMMWGFLMNNMIDILSKVRLAVATKKLIPINTCFHFYKGRVQGNNGAICLDSPFGYFSDEEITVSAVKLYRAAKLCKGSFNYSITNNQRLHITKSKFRALIPIHEQGAYNRWEPAAGNTIKVDGLLKTLQRLRPFISEDASRPWSRSVLFREGYAYATNNVVLARLPAPQIQETRIPVLAVDVLLELGTEPLSIEVSDKAIIFHLPDDMSLMAKLVAATWPGVDSLIRIPPASEMVDLPAYFVETIENLIPFCEDPKFQIIQMGNFGISTAEGASEATVDLGDFPDGIYRAEPLLQVARNAYAVAFHSYPKACYFEGEDDLCGMILGMRL